MSNFITLVLTTRDFFPDIHTYVMEYIKKDMIYMIRCVLDGIKVLSMYHENKFAIGNYFRGDFKNVIQVSWKEQLSLKFRKSFPQ